MRTKFKGVFAAAAGTTVLLACAVVNGYAQCGPDGTQPCNQKPVPVPVVPKKKEPRPRFVPVLSQQKRERKSNSTNPTYEPVDPPAQVPPKPKGPDRNAVAFNDAGNADFAKRDLDPAIVNYTRAISADSNYADPFFNRGLAYFLKNEFDDALSDFDKAINLGLKTPDAYYNRGQAYLIKENYVSAISDFTTVIDMDIEYAPAYFSRGAAYVYTKDYERAITDYTRYIALKPTDPEGYIQRATAYTRAGQGGLAEEDRKKARNL